MEGMGEVLACVTGYCGGERSKLIKLISLSGASYLGEMNRSITHLICWKFEGKKYDLAKRFRTKIVNHQWLEDCIKYGKRIPEAPYYLKSGCKVGSISLDVPNASNSTGLLRENTLSAGPIIDLECEDTEHYNWDDHGLLSKDDKPKKCSLKRTRRHNNVTFDDCEGTTSLKLPRKSCRLVKKCASKQPAESGQETAAKCVSNKTSIEREYVASVSDHSHSDDTNQERMRRQSEAMLLCNELTSDEGLQLQMTQEKSDLDAVLGPRRSKLSREVVVVSEEVSEEVTCSDADKNINDAKNADQAEHPTELPAPLTLSCVICHTEYSSIRGVLPCGHRFCFSCIQSWADHLALKRKASTCPLCKSPFTTITRVEDADCMDQKIYSQTVPCPLSTQDIVILPDGPAYIHRTEISTQTTCCRCYFREPEDLLIYCHMCQDRCIHSYCLDPVMYPWWCNSCKDMRMSYRF